VENEPERAAAGAQVDAQDDVAVSGEVDGLDPATLLTRLAEIERRPLEGRAAALSDLHDELRARLEGGDAAAARG
jgi:hypothetical protein